MCIRDRLRTRVSSSESAMAPLSSLFLVDQRRMNQRAEASPAIRTTNGKTHTNRLKPWVVGASRTHSPYLDTKKFLICCGFFPADNCWRIIPRICCAISEAVSYTHLTLPTSDL